LVLAICFIWDFASHVIDPDKLLTSASGAPSGFSLLGAMGSFGPQAPASDTNHPIQSSETRGIVPSFPSRDVLLLNSAVSDTYATKRNDQNAPNDSGGNQAPLSRQELAGGPTGKAAS